MQSFRVSLKSEFLHWIELISFMQKIYNNDYTDYIIFFFIVQLYESNYMTLTNRYTVFICKRSEGIRRIVP